MEALERVEVDLGEKRYEVLIADGILDRIGAQLKGLAKIGRIAVVTHPEIDRLYGGRIRRSLEEAGYAPLMISLPSGERYKTLRSVSRIYDALVQHRFERSGSLLALGGGVIGDMGGFAAATYLRGISYIQCPTTVVAQVDASIGGKTGVDHPQGKNLIGAFHQPRLVCTDPETLKTLPKREYRAGLAEVVKYGVISDAGFFNYLEAHVKDLLLLDPVVLNHCIRRSARLKAEVVQADEHESGRRKILNYGHTFGHAIETLGGYSRFRHGEAVAIGMAVASQLAVQLGLLQAGAVDRQVALLKALGLPTEMPTFDPEEILKIMANDKKVVSGEIHFVLPEQIGGVRVMPVERRVLSRFLTCLPTVD